MEFIIVSLTVIIVVVSVLARHLLSSQGRGDHRFMIDGMAWQLSRWAITKVEGQFTAEERDLVILAAQAERDLLHAHNQFRKAKAGTQKWEQAQQALYDAQQAYHLAQAAAQAAYLTAIKRWFMTNQGQEWLASKGLRYPA